MSIRILGAYRMKTLSLQRLQAWCDALSVRAIEIASRGFASYLALEICQKLDNHALGFDPIADNDPYSVMAQCTQNALADECPSSGVWDLSLTFLVDSRHIYVMSDYRGTHYTALLDSFDSLEPYNYQNSSDTILDGVSPREWALRGKTWERLLSGSALGERGFKISIVEKQQYCFPSTELVRRVLPGLEARSALVTVEHEISRIMNEMAPDYPNKAALLYRDARRQVLAVENEGFLRERVEANRLLLCATPPLFA
ncbi:hypothetical protein IFT48_00355 [Pseudomonas fluorescens]|uniref:hypothetical protein n=1 Tax=Pseudomonas fluorescens TaxID=294 RepID=UPI0019309DF2|nr:hypothetical protein [Pseudomonas fluorescens]MBD8088442.1 hypothetical protein [Pseudomonas fluorescens]